MTEARAVSKALRGIRFPASRGALISRAFKHDRRRDLRALLDRIPERTYYSFAEVWQETRQALRSGPVRRKGPRHRPGQR